MYLLISLNHLNHLYHLYGNLDLRAGCILIAIFCVFLALISISAEHPVPLVTYAFLVLAFVAINSYTVLIAFPQQKSAIEYEIRVKRIVHIKRIYHSLPEHRPAPSDINAKEQKQMTKEQAYYKYHQLEHENRRYPKTVKVKSPSRWMYL